MTERTPEPYKGDLRPHLPDDPLETFAIGGRFRERAGASSGPASDAAWSPPTVSVGPLDFLPRAEVADKLVGEGAVDAAPRQGYQLLSLAARGGMGEVWRARQESLRRVVAVKRMRVDVFERDPNREALVRASEFAFCQEAFIAGRLAHPNIVPVHDLGVDAQGRPVIAMKYVEGRLWSELLREEFLETPPLEFLAKHLPILAAVAQGVAYAHSRGVVHRDLKASQVMIGRYGQVQLMDWGLAIVSEKWIEPGEPPPVLGGAEAPPATPAAPPLLEEEDALDSILPTPRSASNPAGTPALMAPEQTLATAERVGPWTDVYLLGGVLYWLLSGFYPHHASDCQQSFEMAKSGEAPPPESRAPNRIIPRELSALAMNALRPEPGGRVPSAELFAQRLLDYLAGSERRAEADRLVEKAEASIERHANSYAKLSSALSSLNRAVGLAGESERLSRAAWRAIEAFAALAMSRGDLALAATYARQLPDGAKRGEIEASVARARRQRRLRDFQRRFGTFAAAALFLVIVGGSFFYWRSVKAERDVALEAQEFALAARETAERRRAFAVKRSRQASKIGRLLLDEVAARHLDMASPHDRAVREAIVRGMVEEYRSLDYGADMEDGRLDVAGEMIAAASRFERLSAYAEAEELVAMANGLLDGMSRTHPTRAARAKGLEVLADVKSALGRPDDAIRLYELALVEAPGGPGLLADHLKLTMGLVVAGRLEEAEELCVAILAQQEKAGGAADLAVVAAACHNLAASRAAARRFQEALKPAERALAIRSELFGPESLEAADSMALVAVAKAGLGDADAAIEALREARRIHSERVGPDSSEAFGDLVDMAFARGAAGMEFEAEALLREAVELGDVIFPAGHHRLADARRKLAEVLASRGNYAEALPAMRMAASEFEQAFGVEHAKSVACAEALAAMEVEAKKAASASVP